ncbi:tudor domain-containing protein 6 isoform X2 [Dendrobates tinctorius]|uniref:tudor domain-containing protein 6 isoform X2 n=1 Tax=Dendrobates tinctorius TaxID=92724 RepID=UPI003CC9F8B1
MAGRYPQAGSSMAANMGPAYRCSTPNTSNMAAGGNPLPTRPEGFQSCPPAANPRLPPTMVTMEYFCPRLEIGVSEPMLVTQVLDPHRLFCQLRSMSHEIQRLSESMHQYYEVQQKSCGDQASRFSLALGQPCASCGEDGRWHRSLLQEFFPEKQQALVIHVDWGKKEVLPANRLRNLAPDFFRLPVFTIPCTMYGISNGDFNWDPTLVSDVRALLLQRHVVAKIECYNSFEHLYVVDLFAEDGMNLNGLVRMRSQILRSSQVNGTGTTELPPESNMKIPAKKPQLTPYNPRYPPVELKTDIFEDAVVEFVINPFNFWVRIEKFAAKHNEMINGMTTLYSQASKLEGIITEPKPGQLCCVRYQDLYYRAEVISIDAKKQVKVYFLDNGMLETVDWYNIKELPAEFSKLPALANRCCLADTYPLENTWSQDAILAFKVAVADKKLVIYVVSKDADEYTIEVMDQSRVQETSVGKILAKVGLARFEEIDSVHNHARCRTDAHVESSKTALNPAASDHASKGQETTAADPIEENAETLLYSPFEEQLFEPGRTIEIVVSNVDHPGYFWCQDAASKQDLHALMNAIQSHCVSTNSSYRGDSFACLAKSKWNRMWYRAFITEDLVNLSQKSTVEVLYVDYGNQETVPVANLRALNSEFFLLKAQAFRCSVYNIITPSGNDPLVWDNKATKVFLDFVHNAAKVAEFHCLVYATANLDNELFNIVDLTTPFSSACDTLVKSGYASRLHHTSLAPSVQLHSYYYSMHGIKCGNDEEIYIRHVNSSLMFYMQLTRSGKTIKQISSSIAKFIDKAQKRKLPPINGALCLAKSRDQRWYRGLILSKDESNQIFFVDFGNTEKVSNKNLLPIPSTECELLMVPMQAIKCSLPDIPTKIPTEIVSWFKDVVLDKALRARVVSKDSAGKLSVELYDCDWKINTTLKSKLGLKVPKEKSDHLAPDKFMTFQQDHFTKLPDNSSNQERSSLPVGKTVKSRESNFHRLSEISQEPEPPSYRKTPTVQNKVENKDCNKRFNDLSSQKKAESVPRISTDCSYQGRDPKQDGNKTSSEKQASAVASSVHKSQVKLPVVMLRDIPIRRIFPGMKEHVYVSQINSVFDFYVQVAEDRRLDEISDILNSKTSSFENLGDDDVSKGNVICAYFPDDGLYYRGVVKGTTKQGLCIEYIDYGNVSVISDCKNYRLPQKCLSIPIMSIHCSLNKPENSLAAPNLEEMLAEFSKRTSDILDCEFLKQDGLKWDIILKDNLGCINDLLMGEQKNVEANRMVKKISREEETSFQSFAWNLPPTGESIKVYISTADGPECFWCQTLSADMDTLASQVQMAGEQYVKNDEFIGALKIGSPCNVMFSEDHNWYRAIVTKIEADLVTVRFIDYGNEDSVGRDQIRQLPESLVNLPPQSFLCCLANFDMKEGSWSSEGKQYFYESFTEDALELTVCEVQKSGLCQIPIAVVTIKYKELNIIEEMKNFWQGVHSMDLEPDDLSSIDLLKTNEPHKSRAGEDLPIQKDMMCDGVYPHHGEEQQGATDTMDLCCEEHDDLDEEVLDHAAQRDGVPQGKEDFGKVNDEMADDVSPNFPVNVPRTQGDEVESDHSSCGTDDQFPVLKSSRQQEPFQGNPESVESLILYFNEKLGLTNKGAISDDAAKEEVKTQSEIFDEIKTLPDVDIGEKFEDYTKDGTKQDVYKESKATIPCEDITKEDIVDSKVSTKLLEIVPEDVFILQDEPIQEDMEGYSGLSICADDVPLVLGHVDLVEMEDSFVSVARTVDEKGPSSEDFRDIESIRAEDLSRHEESGSGEVSTEYFFTITSESEEDSISLNITECGEMETKDSEKAIQVGEDIVLGEGAIKEAGDAFVSILTQESTMIENVQIVDEIVPLLKRDVHKMENTIVAIEYDTENKVSIPSEDFTGEDIVDSTVSTGFLEIEPEGVLSLNDNTIQEGVESYGGLNISQDDIPLVLGHVDIAKIEDSFDSVAGTEGEEGPGTEESVDIEVICPCPLKTLEETVSGEVSTEYAVNITYEDSGQGEQDSISFDIDECGDMTTKDYEEEIQVDEDIVLREGVIKESGISFEEFESTIVEGSLTDMSQNFAASGGEELLSGEDMKPKDICEEFVVKEELEREAASFEDFLCESLSANDHEEPEFVQGFLESGNHVVDCGRDECDQSDQPIPADNIDMKLQETDQEQASAGITAEDVLELTAKDETSERNECHRPGGSTKVQLWSYFSEPRFSVRENEDPEDIEECGENTLIESVSQTDDCDTEEKDLGDQGQATESQKDVTKSVKAEPSPVTAEAAEEGKK